MNSLLRVCIGWVIIEWRLRYRMPSWQIFWKICSLTFTPCEIRLENDEIAKLIRNCVFCSHKVVYREVIFEAFSLIYQLKSWMFLTRLIWDYWSLREQWIQKSSGRNFLYLKYKVKKWDMCTLKNYWMRDVCLRWSCWPVRFWVENLVFLM